MNEGLEEGRKRCVSGGRGLERLWKRGRREN